MPSFDVASEVDRVELKNAVENAQRELTSRFDFRGVVASCELKDSTVTLKTESDFQVRQLQDLFFAACAKRGVNAAWAESEDKPVHSGKTFSLNFTFKQGIDQPTAKKMIKEIKDQKLKVQASIQGEKIRVTGKKRDDLQECMAAMKKMELDLPLQFENFRE